jgi:hypothetical protein
MYDYWWYSLLQSFAIFKVEYSSSSGNWGTAYSSEYFHRLWYLGGSNPVTAAIHHILSSFRGFQKKEEE